MVCGEADPLVIISEYPPRFRGLSLMDVGVRRLRNQREMAGAHESNTSKTEVNVVEAWRKEGADG